jgi:three-Cys-motif partner protein
MKGQLNLFSAMPPPAEKPIKFAPAHRPIWTENKAKLIERYLFYFVLITKHGAYIDGFAAPQDSTNPDAWSAKLVLESKPALLRQFWLCELDPERVKRLHELKAGQPVNKRRSITVVPGDFNANVAGLLKESKIDEATATFCLLDQRTFECEWQTLVTLSQHKKTHKIELFYFLGTGWLDRSIKASSTNEDKVRRWWGREDFRDLQGMNSHLRALLFCNRMKVELGYKHANPWPIYSKEKGGRVMYHMIHATDHDEAPKIMNRAYRNALNDRESLARLQKDLQELWGSTGSGDRPKR